VAYCTAAQVRQLIYTSLLDAELDVLITLADQELVDRALTDRSSLLLQRLSMLLTAEMAALKNPTSRTVGELSLSQQSPAAYRAHAERLIEQGRGLAFAAYSEPCE